MKTLRLVGMTMMMVLVGSLMTACSSDDDDNDNGGGGTPAKKHISKIAYTWGIGGVDMITLDYDGQGRVVKMSEEDDYNLSSALFLLIITRMEMMSSW